jgi:5-methylcytosine-specific restriction endonuclease McrA
MPEERVTTKQRQAVAERAKDCCEYCRSQARFATQAFSVEHIKPRSQGGKTHLDNLALACQGCNDHKYDKTEGYDVVKGEMAPLFHPRQQKWSDHFRWSDDFTLIVGLTPTG